MVSSSKKLTDWHTEALPRDTKKALELLSKESWLGRSNWYLAGGTALALQAGHRSSVDLDFFIPEKFNNNLLLDHFNGADWQTDINAEGTIYGTLTGAKVSFIFYPFFRPAKKPLTYGFIKVLEPVDIAVMKIIAISQRGRKRDFFDLYWCAKNIAPLKEFILKLKTQYPSVAHDYHHILKSLVYFIDAENDPTPKINFEVNWKQIKKFFTNEVPRITKEIIELEND
ncbi:MAG: nucleotidyl transferase AbiEii/AbiGii toxin family protein [bacterium]|nr:nucleotidyl transferase AbiEii/AbiGii toxin family protein [bacterium]